ncbi:phage tail tape measure protein [Corynebacterium callunae]|uniref:phage tail tape measure protein n=1 Tax=Corynebacterium callunae TaxID=1721 RepID=UPI001FFE3DB1|nr:phage tail tape measure protein [Corynebacterium callunae]MCK2200476.1 phage tail tape measure protein [Corynebacterium callunae]
MAQAAGYAILPVTASLAGISDELRNQLTIPAQKASKQAGESIRKGMSDGVDKAAKDVEKAHWRIGKAADEQAKAESKLAEQTLKTQAANVAVEAAARKRADAETKGVDAIAKAEQELLKKRAAAEKAARDQSAAEQAVEKALTESARAAESLTQKQKALENSTNETEKTSKGLVSRLKEMGDEAGSTGGMFDGMVGKLGGLAGALAGVAGVAGVGMFAGMGKGLADEIDLVNMQLGYTGASAESVSNSIRETLKGGVAGSAEEAANAVGALESQWKYLGFEGEQTAGQLSDNFLAFSKVFSVDIGEATQTAGQLITNGLATDVEDAADLMTTAMQRVPQAMQGELPEIMNEYGVNFAGLGLSGEEAFGLLVTQAEKGKFALDKTGDALKEFSIRGSDMSTTSATAFSAMGLDFEEMAGKIVAGGDQGREALEQTAQKLLEMEDPAERANAAIALFGAPMEDMGVDQIPQFLEGLTNLEGGMGDVGGASQALADQMANSLDGRLNTLKGTVQSLAGDAFMWVWDTLQNKVVPAFVSFGDWVQRNEDWLKPLGVTVGILTAGYAALATQQSIMAAGSFLAWMSKLTAFTKIQTAAQAAFNVVLNANPLMLMVTAIAAVTAGLVYFFTQTETGKVAWESFTNALSSGWGWVKSTVFDAWTETTGTFSAGWTATTDAVTGAWTWVKDSFTETWNSIKSGVFDAWAATVYGVKAGWDATTSGLSTAWTWLKDSFVAGWELIKTLVFDAFTFYIDTWKLIFETAINLVSGAWTLLKDGLVAGWDIIRTSVFDAFNFYVDLVKTTFLMVMDGIGISWNFMKDTLSSGWSWIRDNVFSSFNSALDLMRSGAETAINGIGTAFDWLRAKTAVPINFVIDPVYSSIREAWGAVANLVDLPELPKIEKIGGFAEGTARVPGARTRHDNVHMVSADGRFGMSLRGGEGVLVPEAVDALGESTVNGLNAAALRGGASSAKKFLGAFADGGVIDSITGIVAEKFPGMSITSTYRPGDPGHHGTGNAVDFSDGTDSTPAMRAAAQYFADNYGAGLLELIHSPFNNNIKNGQSVGDGFGFYGAGTMAAHRNHVHIAAGSPLAGGGSGGVMGVLSGAVNFVGDQAKKLWDGIIGAVPKFEGTGQIAALPGAFLTKTATSAWDFIKEKVGSIGAFNGDPGAGVEQWRPLVEKVLAAKGFSVDLTDTVLRRMNQESGGNSQAINNWDSNAAAGIPSKGLMQVIDPTFAANADPGYSDIWDPESNIRASMNYAIGRYGSLPAAYNREGGYHNGGLAGWGQGILKKTAIEPEMVLDPEMTKAFISWMDVGKNIGETLAPTAQASGRTYLEAQATSALDMFGLGGLVPLGASIADKHGTALLSSAQEMFGGISVTGSLTPGGATLVIEAESDEDLVRVGQLKEAMSDQLNLLNIKFNTKKRPPAAAITGGGVM